MGNALRDLPADSLLTMAFAGFIVMTFAISVVLVFALSFRAFFTA